MSVPYKILLLLSICLKMQSIVLYMMVHSQLLINWVQVKRMIINDIKFILLSYKLKPLHLWIKIFKC